MSEHTDHEHQGHASARDSALRRAGLTGAGVRILTLFVALVTISVSVRSLGEVNYGIAATLATVTAVLGFADLGIGQGLLTKLATAHGRDDVHEMRALVSSAWSTLVVLGGALALIGVALTYLLPWTTLLGAEGVPVGDVRASVLIFFLSTAFAVPAGLGQRIQTALQHGALVSVWQLVTVVATLVAVSLAALLDVSLPAFVLAIIATPVAVSVVQTVVVLGRTHVHLRPSRRFVSREKVRELMSVGGLFFVLGITVAVSYQADALIVSSILGAATAAVFGITARMFIVIPGLLGGLTQQLWPAIAEARARADLGWVRSRFVRVLGITLGGSSLAALGLLVCGQTIARILSGGTLVPPISLLVPFAIWTVYSLGMIQCSYLLNAFGVVAPQVVMAVAIAVVNVPVSIVLTRHIGLPGPIYGSLIAHVLCAGIPTVVLVRRALRSAALGAVAA